ncbi:MAG TPA: DUF6627 family protein [Gammaproteobacteria bacterium]|jgi:hypothetical protein|nr:DUF6627 family protein [Gammaproteobacteria bacterium]
MSWLLSIMLALTPVMSAQAAIVDNDALLAETPTQQHTRDSLQKLFMQDQVRAQLQALGVSPEWASERARTLTDADLARINNGAGQLQAGGESVLGVLLVIFIVFVITDIIGATDIFSFVHPVR